MLRKVSAPQSSAARISTPRKPDGEITIEISGRAFVNRKALAKRWHTHEQMISAYTQLPDGLPFIRLPGRDGGPGLRMLFDLELADKWFLSHQQSPNRRRARK